MRRKCWFHSTGCGLITKTFLHRWALCFAAYSSSSTYLPTNRTLLTDGAPAGPSSPQADRPEGLSCLIVYSGHKSLLWIMEQNVFLSRQEETRPCAWVIFWMIRCVFRPLFRAHCKPQARSPHCPPWHQTSDANALLKVLLVRGARGLNRLLAAAAEIIPCREFPPG